MQNQKIKFFHQAWWLDAACGHENWDVAIIENKENEITAAWPYYYQNRFGFRLLRQAILTPYLGARIEVPKNMIKKSSILAHQKKVIFKLVDQLGDFDYFNQNFHHDFINAQAFAWKKFNSTVQYNFILNLNRKLDTIYADFDSKTRAHVTKATTQLTLESSSDISSFYGLTKAGFEHTKSKIPFSENLISRIYDELKKQDKGIIWTLHDSANRTHASALLVLDQGVIYTLQISSDPSLRSSGAVQMLIWEIIKMYHSKFKYLDFCGTMIERVEPVFRSFGTDQIPYFQISKEASLKYRIASFCKSLLP